jgi:hypothetical protein
MRTSVSEVGNPLLSEDLARLAALVGCEVELLRQDELLGVVLREFELPPDIYNKTCSDVLLQTTTQYPASAMDMFWVEPELTLKDGRIPAGGESLENHFGSLWRRYSWHRNTPWEPGRDDLLGHFEFALARLQRPE